MKLKLEGGTSRVFEIRGSVSRLALGDYMLFTRRSSVRMFRCDFRSEDILFKEALFYKLLHILSEGSGLDGLVSLAFVVEAVFFRPRVWRIMLEWSRTPEPWLIFDSFEYLIDLSFNGVKYSIDLLLRSEFRERIRSACFLYTDCLRCRSWAWLGASWGDFDFPLPSPDFTEWLEETFVASSR